MKIFFILLILFNISLVEAITLKIQSSYPKSMSILGEFVYDFKEIVEKISSDLKIEIKTGVSLDLEEDVSKGKINGSFSGLAYHKHKSQPAINLFTSVPFGPQPLEYVGWMFHGGGIELLNKYFVDENMILFPGCLLPPEAAGCSSKKINSINDFKDLKMRAYGLTRNIFEELGAKTVMMSGENLYKALKNKEIDFAEFSLPSIDLDLKLYEVTKYYYFPGWHQPSTFLFLYLNKDVWNKLSSQQQEIIKIACSYLVYANFTKAQETQKKAIEELRKKTNIVVLSPELLKEFYNAWQKVIKKLSKEEPAFLEVWTSIQDYQKNHEYWQKLNDKYLLNLSEKTPESKKTLPKNISPTKNEKPKI